MGKGSGKKRWCKSIDIEREGGGGAEETLAWTKIDAENVQSNGHEGSGQNNQRVNERWDIEMLTSDRT